MTLQKSKAITSVLPILALAFFLFQALPAWGQQPYYTVPYDPANWMARLKDDTLISKITVPGTHESMSLHPFGLIYQPRCNTLPLKDQLNYGIRLIDIRARYDQGDSNPITFIKIYHGIIDEKANFDPDVLDVSAKFLQEHKSETIFMRVQQTGGTRLADFWRFFQTSVGDDPNASMIWNGSYPDGSEPFSKIPTLGDVRGKIVIMQDFSQVELDCGLNAKTGLEAMTCLPTMGLRYSNYVQGKNKYLFDLQTSSDTDLKSGGSYYTFGLPQIPQRFEEFLNHAERAESSNKIVTTTFGGGITLFQFLPLWSESATPEMIALGFSPYEGMDELLYDSPALAVPTLASSLGMVYMDFPRPALIQKIYELNFAKPVITLLGKPEMVLECGVDTFQDPGATVQDDFDPNIQEVVSGTVDPRKPGTYIITYNATDCYGRKADPVTRTVIVRDTLPPEFNSLSATPNLLWPPNNKFVPINFYWNVVDACDADPSVILTSVTSNEPDSGDIQNALIGMQDPSFLLRANRLGKDQDRIYQITYSARDHSGNQTTRETTVTVSHNNGRP